MEDEKILDALETVREMCGGLNANYAEMRREVNELQKTLPAYLFHIRRCGKGGRRSYDERDFDLMALVALDIKRIAYIKLSEAKQTVHLNREKFLSLSDIRRAL